MAVQSREATDRSGREQTRARYPDETGYILRDGVRVFWERYGEGEPSILLMPTWTIIHSRHWKLQIPYLARSFRVVTFDGRGNGRSDRPGVPTAYADTEFVEDAVAVLDAAGADQAVVAGLSMGAGYAARLAIEHPGRVLGIVMFGQSIPLADRQEDDDHASFEELQPDDEDWAKYNAHYWRRDWPGFGEWFFGQKVFSEPHSTKPIEDAVGWVLETQPETMIAVERAPFVRPPATWEPGPPAAGRADRFLAQIECPVLLAHGTDDHIVSLEHARRVAAAVRARMVEIDGGGHAPILREPVMANLLIRDFARSIERRQ